MIKPELIVFTGNIGCGKSFIASKLAKKGYVIVNNDAITTMVQGGEYGLYDVNKKPLYKIIETTAISEALKDGFSVVVDRTNMKASDRNRYVDIGKEHNADIISYCWGRGNIIDLERRNNHPRGIPEKTWIDVSVYMYESYEEPTPEEGFSEIRLMQNQLRFFAFDFDGTIAAKNYPDIGERIEPQIARIRTLYKDLCNVIIIWTCRSGDKLNLMREYLIKNQIPFDFINENPLFNTGSRKIFAHEYYDDRNVEVKSVRN